MAAAKKKRAKKPRAPQKNGGRPLPKFAGVRGRGRTKRTPGVMNNLERSYSELLEGRRLAGEIIAWEFEPMNIRVSRPMCYYKPDFLVITIEGYVEFHETKGGHFEHDSIVRTKVVAERFPYFVFRLVRKKKKADGGGFTVTTIGKHTEDLEAPA